MRKVNAPTHVWLHLMPHDQIFIIKLVIRTVVKRARQKTHHIILIEIHVTDIALVILIINKVHAGIAVRYFLHLIAPFMKPSHFSQL